MQQAVTTDGKAEEAEAEFWYTGAVRFSPAQTWVGWEPQGKRSKSFSVGLLDTYRQKQLFLRLFMGRKGELGIYIKHRTGTLSHFTFRPVD